MANPQALPDLPSLYDYTENIGDINTLLISADAYRALTARTTTAAPAGWQLVPIEPTKAMVEACHRLPDILCLGEEWSAMLAASPKGPL